MRADGTTNHASHTEELGRIIDGSAIARRIRDKLAVEVQGLARVGVVPGLAVILVGDDPASAVYVASKERACVEAGMNGITIRLPATTTQAELLTHVRALNDDASVHGILVQMPLPKQIDPDTVIRAIDPMKDVDGFHPINVGKLLIGEEDGFAPCTPAGVQELLIQSGVNTLGKDIVLIGRSNIVGKPMAALLLQDHLGANATVTICHRYTRDLPSHTRRADILIAAAGRPKLVTADMVKPGVVVIDVGINRVSDPGSPKGYRLVGDVDFDAVRPLASQITPVPKGVGPMTIAMLLKNTVRAATMHAARAATAGAVAAGELA
ncbi:MAG TPA: bifunctional methylenetetrahydrofolate dehydrogenase/methenyltetrahydrofolate cyclohydrolase FolD [Gemmatimonadaceae bacterium]|nr:bifunctional methylenetetrahydrofolate dehydrogenase/methenyltetrahydrofolate cyclohydrolase FolD [Gemmatimonadaceae bacterium]